MLFREINAVSCKKHTEHVKIQTVWAEFQRFVMTFKGTVELDERYVYSDSQET
jgi:hypothetical protein